MRMAGGLILALAIAASVPAENLDAVKRLLIEVGKAAGCANPRVAMVGDAREVRVEVDCPYYEEGYL